MPAYDWLDSRMERDVRMGDMAMTSQGECWSV